MLFSSYEFIFLFLPIVLTVYFTLSKFASITVQHIFLVLSSLFFYAYFKIEFLPIIVISMIVNYVLAMIMKKFQLTRKSKSPPEKIVLALGVIFNLFLLGYYKYYDFTVSNINSVLGTEFVLRNVILPLGISFFTFQQLSFIVSVYKQEEKVENFIDYCLFVSFFPQLVAGPIVLYSEMIPQFKDDSRRYFNMNNFTQGLYCFMYGLFKKLVIADSLALFVTNGYTTYNISMSAAWVCTLSYTFQMYFDFSGYSDMAIGLGKMFNINIPNNFDHPYRSTSLTEFWQRWHVTLGRALKNYVYIPLGGSRKGVSRTYINLFITFFLSGVWHGAAWTYIGAGFIMAIIVILEKVFKKYFFKIPKAIRGVYTFLIVNAFFATIRASSLGAAKDLLSAMFDIKSFSLLSIADITQDGILEFIEPEKAIITPIFLIIASFIIIFFCKSTMDRVKKFECNSKTMTVTALLFAVCIIHLPRLSTFIYFNF